MRYTKTYTDEDFLKALDKIELRSAGYVANIVQCTLPTAKTALRSLVERGLVENVKIDDGKINAYKLKEA